MGCNVHRSPDDQREHKALVDNEMTGATDPSVNGVDPDEYQHLLEDYSHLAPPSRHEVLEGKVLKISGADVFIDVGYKSEGVAPLAEFADADGNVSVRPGDIVEVMVHSGHSSEGYVLLSHEKAARLKIWDTLEKALEEQLTISGRVLGRVTVSYTHLRAHETGRISY